MYCMNCLLSKLWGLDLIFSYFSKVSKNIQIWFRACAVLYSHSLFQNWVKRICANDGVIFALYWQSWKGMLPWFIQTKHDAGSGAESEGISMFCVSNLATVERQICGGLCAIAACAELRRKSIPNSDMLSTHLKPADKAVLKHWGIAIGKLEIPKYQNNMSPCLGSHGLLRIDLLDKQFCILLELYLICSRWKICYFVQEAMKIVTFLPIYIYTLQICRFCWNKLRTEGNGLCPACRQVYLPWPS